MAVSYGLFNENGRKIMNNMGNSIFSMVDKMSKSEKKEDEKTELPVQKKTEKEPLSKDKPNTILDPITAKPEQY